MNPAIQWEEDWFTVAPSESDLDLDHLAQEQDTESQEQDQEQDTESQEQDQEQDTEPESQEKEKEKEKENPKEPIQEQEPIIQGLQRRLEQLYLLVHKQSEQIAELRRELREQEQKQQQPHTAASDIAALLEELKRVKERELNLALRRHQPVPFFDSGMLQRMIPYPCLVPRSSHSPLFKTKL